MSDTTQCTVLVVDDNPIFRHLVTSTLERDGCTMIEAVDAETALALLEDSCPDLLVLDIELPGMSGLELLHRVRDRFSLPVILLTCRESESDRVLGLDLGADDYVIKPFLPRELSARARAVLRRAAAGSTAAATAPAAAPASLIHGALRIATSEREVTLEGSLIDVTPREFDLLVYLASRPRQAVSRRELLEQVWSSSDDWQDPATVTEHIRRLRRKIEVDPDEPRWLLTVRGIGYRFEPVDSGSADT